MILLNKEDKKLENGLYSVTNEWVYKKRFFFFYTNNREGFAVAHSEKFFSDLINCLSSPLRAAGAGRRLGRDQAGQVRSTFGA
ncbi:hypothetical protein B1B05_09815 [Domibacillus enclensis]|uniref:Uncharacterized protein n=1 Tax=Domibacillus enclensis TaxID=1017273 RepID=A0ABX4E9E7_9BACI|nr:hypothetical protein B1B05_09815 [Domibacillus enclensis]